jgi:hypothetical protein
MARPPTSPPLLINTHTARVVRTRATHPIARLRVQEGCSFSAAATPPSLRRDGMAAHFRFAEARRFVFCLK